MSVAKILSIFILCSIMSCSPNKSTSKYLVTTKVAIKEGEIKEVLKLFQETNPALVSDQTDWVKAVFSANETTNTVMVQAYWKNKKSYLAFSQSKKFQETMKLFGKHFAGSNVINYWMIPTLARELSF